MKPEVLAKFRGLFEQQRQSLVYSKNVLNEEFDLKREDMVDEIDMSSTEIENNMRVRLRNREALYLKKIDEALRRIADGTFGVCESCEEEIETRRLEARPTATLCVQCKETQEKAEHLHIDGHRHKSLGAKTFKLA